MKIKEIRNASGLTQEAFARKYNIPKRTLEGWEAGKRNPPGYVLELLERVVKEDTEKTEKEKTEMYYNTIILKHGVGSYTKKQFDNFVEGDCVCGENANPEELKRWSSDPRQLMCCLLGLSSRFRRLRRRIRPCALHSGTCCYPWCS